MEDEKPEPVKRQRWKNEHEKEKKGRLLKLTRVNKDRMWFEFEKSATQTKTLQIDAHIHCLQAKGKIKHL